MSNLRTGSFYFFLRLPGPVGAGHLGWGFQSAPDEFIFGSLENATANNWSGGAVVGRNGDNDYWWATSKGEAKMLNSMKNMSIARRSTDQQELAPYTHYKRIEVPNPNVTAAFQMGKEWAGYSVFAYNCLDNSARVADKYGVVTGSRIRHVPLPGNSSMTPRGFYTNGILFYAEEQRL